MVRILICIPTYNESMNIRQILDRTLSTIPAISRSHPEIENVEILVIDDGSPDGTAKMVADHYPPASGVHLLNRSEKGGLGPAYIAGFRWGIERGFTHFVEMDADGSHQPEELERLIEEISSHELVLGARWIPGGKVVNWPLYRRLLSQMGTRYARFALKLPYKDLTGGYRILSKGLLEKIDLSAIQTRGYGFQIELVSRSVALGATISEVPITFIERERGKSKMSGAIAVEALWQITKWGLRRLRAS